MIIKPLDTISHPDFNDVVIHFTGRQGRSNRSSEIAVMSDWERLTKILQSSTFISAEMFGVNARAVCFTEGTAAGCSWLISEGRYSSCGIAFSKRYLFSLGGGPVLQIRGDEWPQVESLSESVRARVVRLWPGASVEFGENLPWWLERRSEWLYEREWRLPSVSGSTSFDLDQVAFLVIPSVDLLYEWVKKLTVTNIEMARAIAKMRYVVIGPAGILASNGVRQRGAGKLLTTVID